MTEIRNLLAFTNDRAENVHKLGHLLNQFFLFLKKR